MVNQLPILFRKYNNITCYFTILNIAIEKLNSLITENVLYKVRNFFMSSIRQSGLACEVTLIYVPKTVLSVQLQL